MRKKVYKAQAILLCLLLFVVAVLELCIHTSDIYAYEQKSGTVNGDYVNVRTGAGTGYPRLSYNGGTIQLNKGADVTVIGEEKASDGALWYKISFSYSKTTLTGYIHGDYVDVETIITYEPDADFEAYLKEQGFPDSYKDGLRALHAKYPKWVFLADKTDYTWEEVLENESKIGVSLISSGAISSWKSTDPKAYNWDTGKWYGLDGAAWVAASKELVAYCLDPRNFLDEQSVFQFESLSYNSGIHTLTGLRQVISGSFLSGAKIENNMWYSNGILKAAQETGVSPYNLAVRIIQEQGTGGEGLSISGTVPGYEGYYNYFNIGAYAANGNSAIINGLIYAKSGNTYSRPWNTRYKSILGGAQYLGSGYISQGQDTLYYQKFDLVGVPYTHQYMTHILAPGVEGKRMATAYSDSVKKQTALVFKIPVYENMPKKAAACPVGDGNPNNALGALKVDGYNLTPTFHKFEYEYNLIVKNSVSEINVSAVPLDASATVAGTGKKSLKVGTNHIDIVVTAKNGSSKTYTLIVVRKKDSADTEPESPDNPQEPTTEPQTPWKPKNPVMTSKYTVEGKYISGLKPGTTVKTALSKFTVTDGTAKILNADGKEASAKDTVGTGYQYVVYNSEKAKYAAYTFVIYGDVSGEGAVDIKDLLYVKLQILGKVKLKGVKLMAADASRGNDGVDIKDLLYVKLHILEKLYIVQ